MELRMVARVLLRRWWLILIPLVITIGLTLPALLTGTGAGISYTTMIRYSAAQQVEALPPRDGDLQDIWLASEYTVNAMTAWVQTDSFKQEVAIKAAEQGVALNQPLLGVAADNQRSVGQLFLSYPQETDLAVIVQAAIEVLTTRNQFYFPQMGSAPANVTILDTPVISAAPPPLTNRFEPFIRIGLGLLAGIGLALLAHYLDPTLRRREDVEALGLPVIATLPRE